MIIIEKAEAPPNLSVSARHCQSTPAFGGAAASTAAFMASTSKQSLSRERAFDCPLCPLSISHGLRRNHLAKHFYAQLSAEVASKSASSAEAPFECHLCRHVAITRNGLIKHVGVVHQLVDQYVKDYNLLTTSNDDAVVTSEAVKTEELPTSSASTLLPITSATTNKHFECRLCDNPQFFR
jgi:hypothetical protein